MNAPSGYKLEQVMSAWMSARARILADDPDIERDEGALTALMGPADGDVKDILARLLRAANHAEAMAKSAKDMAEHLAERQSRYKTRAQSMRGTAFAIMDAIGECKIELPDMTASIRRGTQSALITDETVIPEEYIRVTRIPDKAAILADLKQGVIIEGAQLSNGTPSLSIRTR